MNLEVKHRVSAALAEVASAEESLERALRELSSAPRADKIVVTDAVHSAIIRLRRARESLAVLHEAVDATE